MPFIKKERRKQIDAHGLYSLPVVEAGDRCYYFYKQMMDQWHTEPRWTTAHSIYRKMTTDLWAKVMEPDDRLAYELAWQVFFAVEVVSYELRKRYENGGI